MLFNIIVIAIISLVSFILNAAITISILNRKAYENNSMDSMDEFIEGLVNTVHKSERQMFGVLSEIEFRQNMIEKGAIDQVTRLRVAMIKKFFVGIRIALEEYKVIPAAKIVASSCISNAAVVDNGIDEAVDSLCMESVEVQPVTVVRESVDPLADTISCDMLEIICRS